MSEVTTSSPESASTETSALEGASREAANLRREREHLEMERDNAQLRAELAQLARPWWRKGSAVTTLTAIIAAAIPITTAVQAYFQKERELAMAQSQKDRDLALQGAKQAHEIRMSYLDRLDKPGRMRTLRFVHATTDDPVMRSWAHDEMQVVQADIEEINRKILVLSKEIEGLEVPARASQAKSLVRDTALRRSTRVPGSSSAAGSNVDTATARSHDGTIAPQQSDKNGPADESTAEAIQRRRDEIKTLRAHADTLFAEGKLLMASPVYKCDPYEAALKIDASDIGAIIELALCNAKRGQLASAWKLYSAAEKLTRDATDERNRKMHFLVVERQQELEPRLSRLTVKVSSNSRIDNLTVMINGEKLTSQDWNRSFPVDGGDYSISAFTDSKDWSSQIVVLGTHDNRIVEIPEL